MKISVHSKISSMHFLGNTDLSNTSTQRASLIKLKPLGGAFHTEHVTTSGSHHSRTTWTITHANTAVTTSIRSQLVKSPQQICTWEASNPVSSVVSQASESEHKHTFDNAEVVFDAGNCR